MRERLGPSLLRLETVIGRQNPDKRQRFERAKQAVVTPLSQQHLFQLPQQRQQPLDFFARVVMQKPDADQPIGFQT